MKKITSLLAIALSVIFLSCGSDSSSEPASNWSPSNVQLNEYNGMKISEKITAGWNLGNTLDATDGKGVDSETSWGCPKTTKENIQALAASGINLIRIPVSWSNHMDDTTGVIDPAWISRVQEVVGWAIECNMFVILNVHHDVFESKYGTFTSYNYKYYNPTSADRAHSEKFVKNVWEQICRNFNENYDAHLIFEALNEPRVVGDEHEWNYQSTCQKCNEIVGEIQHLNQLALNTIRASGKNNALRLVIFPFMSASTAVAYEAKFSLPTDSASNVGLSVHAYSPYSFAMESPGETTFTDNHKKDLDYLFISLKKKYGSYPIIIGEYGATNKNNPQDRAAWFEYYVKKAKENGIKTCLWDNNQYNVTGSDYSEKYGFFNRSNNTWYEPELLNAIMRGTK